MNDPIQEAAALIGNARYLAALTGAGHSTPSGIPDFRSPGSGLWEKSDPTEVASLEGFLRHPAAYYQWIRPLAVMMKAARPNPAHLALAELERRGILKVVITQNIDGLHQAAGSQQVLELHGNHSQATCLLCYKITPTVDFIDRVIETGEVPHCACGGVLKPNVVFFGEMLPAQTLYRAEQAARECDVMLVAGSSLEVAPAGDLPWLTVQRGAKLIIVNKGRTHLDSRATVLIRDDVATVLPAIVEAL